MPFGKVCSRIEAGDGTYVTFTDDAILVVAAPWERFSKG